MLTVFGDKGRYCDGVPRRDFLMARRLVEAGVRCVTLAFGRWDTHDNNFGEMRNFLPKLDQAVTALVQDLHDRGLDKDVSVVVWGEFGRIPEDQRARWSRSLAAGGMWLAGRGRHAHGPGHWFHRSLGRGPQGSTCSLPERVFDLVSLSGD